MALRRGSTTASLLFLLAAALARSAATAPAPADAPADWPQFRGNPALTGVARSTLPDKPPLLWTYEAGEAIESSAAIADGTVFVAAQPGELVALDLGSGAVRWKYPIEGRASASRRRRSRGGRVYVGDLKGTLHAVDARTGKAAWTYKTEGEIKSSPVVVGDRVLIGSYDGHLHAVAARTGQAALEVQDRRPGPRDAGGGGRRRLRGRLRRGVPRRAHRRRPGGPPARLRRLHRRLAGAGRRDRPITARSTARCSAWT